MATRTRPTLALGTVQWGLAYGVANTHGQASREEVSAILATARNAGLALIDTARAYGEAESVVGALAGPGSPWRVVTKLAPTVWNPGDDEATALTRVRDSLEASRRALGRARLDTVLLHRPVHRTCCGGALWSALRDARDRGEIGTIGISATTPQDAFEALDDPDVAVMQVAGSLFDQRLQRAGFFEDAAAAGTEIHLRSVFLQGVAFMTPKTLPEHLRGLAGALSASRAWAERRGVSAGTAFLRYACTLPVAALVLGSERRWQLESNLAAWRDPLTDDERESLRQLADAVGVLDGSLINPARWATSEAHDPS